MDNLDLSQIKKVFFIGIGGIGISALAKMAISQGMEVSGINDENTPSTLDPLRELGATIYLKEDLSGPPVADMYVYSDAWLHRGPTWIAKGRGSGKPTLSYFEALGAFSKKYKVIAVSGTHGKTTTTAMISGILIDAGLDPTAVVGSMVKRFDPKGSGAGSNFRKGYGEWMVVEADEYNKHFLNFNPFITVITNIEKDHLDFYKDLEEIQGAFKELLTKTIHAVIYNGEDWNTHAVVRGSEGEDAAPLPVDYLKYLPKVPSLLVPGSHNKLNAAAALAVSTILGISEEVAQKSLSGFGGTWRRLERRGTTAEGTIVYDDYAHHPTEIKASLEALRELYPGKKITVLFQPHLYSRTRAFFDDFAKSFRNADRILLLPIYFAREDKDENVSSEKLAEAIGKVGGKGEAFTDFEAAGKVVVALNLGPNDVFVTMGAGEAYKVADQVLKFT